MPETMRAVVVERLGGPEVLRVVERPIPTPGPTEVLVRVHAAGVNPVDWKTRAGRGVAELLGSPPWGLGWDVSGVIAAVGGGVTRFRVGDEVFGMPRFPAQASCYADYTTAPSRQLANKPSTVDHVTAGATPLAALTAWQALIEAADLRRGQRVLVHGAGGGVGHVAVQLAVWRGAVVVGTASGGKHSRLRELGASQLVDHRVVRFEDVIEPVDVVLDLVGGDYAYRSLDVLLPGGLLLEIPSGGDLPSTEVLARRGVTALTPLVEPDGHALRQIARLIDAGTLRVDVTATAPLHRVGHLHRQGEQGHLAGKSVVDISR